REALLVSARVARTDHGAIRTGAAEGGCEPRGAGGDLVDRADVPDLRAGEARRQGCARWPGARRAVWRLHAASRRALWRDVARLADGASTIGCRGALVVAAAGDVEAGSVFARRAGSAEALPERLLDSAGEYRRRAVSGRADS